MGFTKEMYSDGIIRPQSKYAVLEASLNIVELFKPCSILEIGIGRGDWLLAAGMKLDDIGARFYGIDDFSEPKKRHKHHIEELTWPDTVEKLQAELDSRVSELQIKGNFIAIEGDVEKTLNTILKKLNTTFDCIRIDCLCQNKEPIKEVIEKCLEYANSQFLLLVDDLGPNQCSSRFLACADLVEEDKIKPLWYSEDEAAYTNLEFDSDSFISFFEKISEDSHYEIRPPINFTYSNHRKITKFIRTSSR